MGFYKRGWSWGIALIILVLFFSTAGSVTAHSQVLATRAGSSSPNEAGMVVGRIYYQNKAQLDALGRDLDVWEVHPAEKYLVAMLSKTQYASLSQAGYRLEIDAEKTAQLGATNQYLGGQTGGIPGYPCYRTVEETYAAMDALVSKYPNLASKVKIGQSWEKIHSGGTAGYDMFVIVLTNKSKPAAGKSKYFVMGEIHAREYSTAETALRFAEYLLQNYGRDPDITWMLDYNEVHILPMANPDGRKIAEQGYTQRKNVDNANSSSCPVIPTDYAQNGIDLNRNSSFQWGQADTNPCGLTYQGPSAASEPETVAIQNYLASIFPPDQRGPGINDSAPADATGAFVTLHSYADVVLFPWGWTTLSAPNQAQLQTLGRKFGYFNHSDVCQSNSDCMYATSGTTDDWTYGNLGVAAYTFEIGTAFFESCSTFTNVVLPDNESALLYGVKAARQPYLSPGGPDTLAVTATPGQAALGKPVKLTATADDTRYYGGYYGDEPVYPISGARYSIDQPSWVSGTITYPMTASDGAFDQTVEQVEATVDTSGLPAGRHLLFVEAKIASDRWGPPTAVYLDIRDDFLLTPAAASGRAEPGAAFTYSLNIANLGAAADSYSLSVQSQNGWQVTLPPNGQVGPVQPGGSADFQVTVTVPADYYAWPADVTTLTITSGDTQKTDTILLTTTPIFIYASSLTPAALEKTAYLGNSVSYTLNIANKGNTPDTYTVDTYSDSGWLISAPAQLGPVLPGQSLDFQVVVMAPGWATIGMPDNTAVTVTSGGPAQTRYTAMLTTTPGYHYYYVPFVSGE